MKVLNIISYLALAIFIAYLATKQISYHEKVGEVVSISSPILLLNGQKTQIKKYLNKPLVLVFWASWCTPCHEQLKILTNVYRKYKNKINILALGIDSENYNMEFPVGIAQKENIDDFKAYFVPLTYVLNKDGKVLFVKNKIVNEDEFLSILKSLGI